MNENDYFIKQGIIKEKETVFECLSFLQANQLAIKELWLYGKTIMVSLLEWKPDYFQTLSL